MPRVDKFGPVACVFLAGVGRGLATIFLCPQLTFLSHGGTMYLLQVCMDFSLTLGSPFVDDLACVSVLLFVWCEA